MTTNNPVNVAVLGMGIMGEAIAHNLDEDGVLTATWNRTERPGLPKYKKSIHEAVKVSNIVLVLVTDDQAVSEILDLILPELDNRHLVIQCSTVNPSSNIQFQKKVETTGAQFIEALIGGSKGAAISRKIVFYLGGNRDATMRAEPVLKRIAADCIHVGETGMASHIKLAMNLNIALQVEALCESFAYARRAGIDTDTYFRVLQTNTARNRLSEYKEPVLRKMDFAPQFSVKNMHKDVLLALQNDGADNRLVLLSALEQIFSCAEEKGLSEEDMMALIKLLQD